MTARHASSCDHHLRTETTKAQLQAAAATAKGRAEKAGLRWTAQRERALELLLQANGPVKAYDLVATFQPAGATAPPTVYRALDALVDLGLAHKIASQNAYIACLRDEHEAHTASFLFCDCCGAVEEFDAPVGEIVKEIGVQSRFQLRALTVEAHGLCGPCHAGGGEPG